MSRFIQCKGESNEEMFKEIILASDINFYKRLDVVVDGIQMTFMGAKIIFKDDYVEIQQGNDCKMIRNDCVSSIGLSAYYDIGNEWDLCRMASNEYVAVNDLLIDGGFYLILEMREKVINEFIKWYGEHIPNYSTEIMSQIKNDLMVLETISELNNEMSDLVWDNIYYYDYVVELMNDRKIESLHDLVWVNSIINKFITDIQCCDFNHNSCVGCENCIFYKCNGFCGEEGF